MSPPTPAVPNPNLPLDLAPDDIRANAHGDPWTSPESRHRFDLQIKGLPTNSPYQEQQSIVKDLHDAAALRKRPFGPVYLSINNAVQKLCSAHHDLETNMTFERRQAFSRLHTLQCAPDKHGFWADLAYRIFNDLDVGLFEGLLTGNVFLTWGENFFQNGAGVTKLMDHSGFWDERMRIKIELSMEILLLDARASIPKLVDTLVHEMIHAYLYLVADENASYHGHKAPYQQCFEAVNLTLRKYTGFSTSLVFVWDPY